MRQWLERANKNSNSLAHGLGKLPIDSLHNPALFAIGGTSIAWSAVVALIAMMHKIDDILLLSLATLVVRDGSARYPSIKSDSQP